MEVGQRHAQRDVSVLNRWLLVPPMSATRKFPKVTALIDHGIRAEEKGSNWTRRLNNRWTGITKGIDEGGMATLTALLFKGDAEAHVWTDAELKELGASPAVRTAYRKSRRFLDALGTIAENHNKKMNLKVSERLLSTLRTLAGARNMDALEFRGLWRKRAQLQRDLRAGKRDPDEIAAEIDAATDAVIGRAGDGDGKQAARFRERFLEADRLQQRLDDGRVKRRVGYVPHKFFGRWRLWEQVGTDDDGSPQWRHVAGEHGFWPSREAAVKAAAQIAEERPNSTLRVHQVEFNFPESQATELSDAAYWRFRNQVGKLTQLQGSDLQEAVTGAARRRFRRRIAGFSRFRSGVEGYSHDLDRVMRQHIGEVVRYVTMDRLKFDAINLMEAEGLSDRRSTVQTHPELARTVQQWWRDVNGQKSLAEEQVDALLEKEWMSPVKAGLGAAAAAWLASGSSSIAMGVASTPGGVAVPLLVGAYIGFRVGWGAAKGGAFKSRAITGGLLSDMAQLKLGVLTNLFSPLYNAYQTGTNTYPVLGARWTAVGIKRFSKAVASAMRGKPNSDYRLLERFDINPMQNFTEWSPNQYRREPLLLKFNMALFTGAEVFNRGSAFLGAYSRAIEAGASAKAAQEAGRSVMKRTQLDYESSAKPEALRGAFLRVPLQFKNFIAQQLRFALGLRGKEIGRFMVSMTLLAGTLGLPFADLLDELTEWTTGFSPMTEAKALALDAMATGELVGGMATFAIRGVPGLLGLDALGRGGMGDKFLPLDARDLQGPWISTLRNAIRLGELNAGIADHIRNISPGMGNPLKAIETTVNGGVATNPWRDGLPEYEMSVPEQVLKAFGGRPMREALMQDLRDVERYENARDRRRRRHYLSRIRDRLSDGDAAGARKIASDALAAGVPITGEALRRAVVETGRDRPMRDLRRLPVRRREEGLRRREAVGLAADR